MISRTLAACGCRSCRKAICWQQGEERAPSLPWLLRGKSSAGGCIGQAQRLCVPRDGPACPAPRPHPAPQVVLPLRPRGRLAAPGRVLPRRAPQTAIQMRGREGEGVRCACVGAAGDRMPSRAAGSRRSVLAQDHHEVPATTHACISTVCKLFACGPSSSLPSLPWNSRSSWPGDSSSTTLSRCLRTQHGRSGSRSHYHMHGTCTLATVSTAVGLTEQAARQAPALCGATTPSPDACLVAHMRPLKKRSSLVPRSSSAGSPLGSACAAAAREEARRCSAACVGGGRLSPAAASLRHGGGGGSGGAGVSARQAKSSSCAAEAGAQHVGWQPLPPFVNSLTQTGR